MIIIEIKEVTSVPQKRRQWLPAGPGKGDKGTDYTYVDDEWPVERTRVLLMQSVESIDLPGVIAAINGMGYEK